MSSSAPRAQPEPRALPGGAVLDPVRRPLQPDWRTRAWQTALRTGTSLARKPSALIGLAIVVFWTLCAAFWPLFTPYAPDASDYAALTAPPSAAHFFGTDQYGHDVLSQVLAGSREVLLVAPAATLVGLLGGIAVGLVAAYYGGWRDEIIMRVMDAIMAFPFIILALLILVVLGPSPLNVILVIGFGYVPLIARVVRSAALGVRELDYVAAARLRGARGPAIMLTEVLPNITGPIVVEATTRVGYAVFATASLSFLGLGLPPPSTNWGAMINDTHALLPIDPWIVIAPTLAIASLVVAINLVADGLKGAMRA